MRKLMVGLVMVVGLLAVTSLAMPAMVQLAWRPLDRWILWA